MWRVPIGRSQNEVASMSINMFAKIKPLLPEYHTRAMRKEFKSEVKRMGVNIPDYVLRHIYRRLLLDASADQNPALHERMKLAIASDNYEMIVDLRHLNQGRPGDTFKEFFSVLNGITDEWVAADERRHGVAHMSQFISVPDLIEQVKKKLPPDTPVPSIATVELAFAPPNISSAATRHYTGKVNLTHKVQARQLRSYHPDAHFCAAQYKYMREVAMSFRKENVIFLSADDKAKIMVGEPSLPISSGVRGNRHYPGCFGP